MSGVKRTRTDDIPSTQSQTTTTTTTTITTATISPKVETSVAPIANIEEDYNWWELPMTMTHFHADLHSSPICFELINEAYVSRCGHSFWWECHVLVCRCASNDVVPSFAVVNVFNAPLNLTVVVPSVNWVFNHRRSFPTTHVSQNGMWALPG